MQKTFAKVVKEIVENSIDRDYIAERGSPGTGAATLRQVYEEEFGYNGHSPKACKDYLQGLPTVCTIPFMNHEILEILAQNGYSKPTEKGQYSLIERYWELAGAAFYSLTKKG